MPKTLTMIDPRPNGSGGQYERGQTYTLADDLADYFLSIGVARYPTLQQTQVLADRDPATGEVSTIGTGRDPLGAPVVAVTSPGGGVEFSDEIQAAIAALAGGDSELSSDLASAEENKGAALIGFLQSGGGAVERTVEAKLRETVSVKDFGAVGDGVTDDTDAIQAALDALKNNQTLLFPIGNYKATAPLVMAPGKSWQSLVGGSPATGSGGSNGTLSSITFSGLPANAVAITPNTYATVENLGIFGPGFSSANTFTCIATDAKEINIQNCTIQLWNAGISIKRCYYSRLGNVNFRFNNNDLIIEQNYTLSGINLSFNGMPIAGQTYRTPVTLNAGGNIQLVGGSIEGYYGAHGIKFAGNSCYADLTGVYFEGYGEGVASAQSGIYVEGLGCTLNMRGCVAHVYNTTAFVNFDANAYNFTLNASGNIFLDSSGTPSTIYKLPSGTTQQTTSVVNIGGDNIYGCASDPVYFTPALGGSTVGQYGYNVAPPSQGLTEQTALTTHQFFGKPLAGVALSAAPSFPLKGAIYWANGSSWNPFKSDYSPYQVVYDGTSYQQVTRPKKLTTCVNANRTLLANENAVSITDSAAVTVTLPASPADGDTHTIKHYGGANATTVSGNGKQFEGAGGSSYTLTGGSLESITVVFSSYANRWLIVSKT